jgi:hypothetical protein
MLLKPRVPTDGRDQDTPSTSNGRYGSTPGWSITDTSSNSTGAVATRFDKLAVRYEVAVHVASINIWLRDLE